MIARRLANRAALRALVISASFAAVAARAEAVHPPARTIDAKEQPASGPVVALPNGGNLQRALDRAAPGTTIVLAPGSVFNGPIVLPSRSDNAWITIRSSGNLPPAGTRAIPSDAASMPKIVASGGPAIRAALSAHHVRFVGVEIRPRAGEFVKALVELGENAMLTEELPHDIIFDRCFIHGDPQVGGRRGIAMNGGATAVIDSTLIDFKETGADSQAIAGWSGTGPFLIANNWLEAAGENVLFGGADAPGPDRIPSDIVVRGNSFEKPLAWKTGTPQWSVKNLFELKDARRVLITGNTFERVWAQAQNGFAILFTVRNQDGTAPWSVVEDVSFTGNVVRGAGGGVNILGRDDSHGGRSGLTKRIEIRGNRFEDLGGAWGGTGGFLQVLQGPIDIDVEHNTALQTGTVIMAEGPVSTGFVFRDNIVRHNEYGITGTGAGTGIGALATYFPGAVVEGNVFIGGDAGRYPANNVFVKSDDEVFADKQALHLRAKYSRAGAPEADPQAHASR